MLSAILPEKWNSASDLEGIFRAHAEQSGLKLGKVAQPLRAAVTGKTSSPPLFDMLRILGPDETLARLRPYAPKEEA